MALLTRFLQPSHLAGQVRSFPAHIPSQPGSSQARRAQKRGGLSRIWAGVEAALWDKTRSALVISVVTLSGALAAPPQIQAADDGTPTAQAKAINAEFLANLPAPATGAKAICIVDTGVTINEDLQDAVIARAAVDGGSVEDLGSRQHGTQVAMSAVGKAGNNWGSAGIWPAGKFISVRASSEDNPDQYSWQEWRDGMLECNVQAISSGVTLAALNISIGGLSASESELAALEEVIARERDAAGPYNMSVVIAAGNDSSAQVSYPARFEDSFAIGASSSASGALCDFSNYGVGLDIVAPGCNNDGADQDGIATDWRGTSISAPITSAVLAALRSYRTDLSAEEAEQLLVNTAQITSAGKVIDAEAVFRAAGLGSYVDAYSPPSSNGEDQITTTGNDFPSNVVSSTNSSSSKVATELSGETSKIDAMTFEDSWPEPQVAAEWRSMRGTVYVRLKNVPKGVKLESDNNGIAKTHTLKRRNPLVKIKQDRLSKMAIRIRYIGKGGRDGDITKVGGYWPLPGRCISNVVEETCYTAVGRSRRVTRKDHRAIDAALKHWKRYEKRQKSLRNSLGL